MRTRGGLGVLELEINSLIFPHVPVGRLSMLFRLQFHLHLVISMTRKRTAWLATTLRSTSSLRSACC